SLPAGSVVGSLRWPARCAARCPGADRTGAAVRTFLTPTSYPSSGGTSAWKVMGKVLHPIAGSRRRAAGWWVAGVAASLALGGCSSKGSNDPAPGAGAGSAALVAVEFGSLVDVYGLRKTESGAFTAALYERDVLIGSDIVDERDGVNRNRRDNEILYDFLSANPDNLQPRLLITREIGSPEFERAFDALDDRVRRVAPGRFGQ